MEFSKEKNEVKTAVTTENGKIIKNMYLQYKSTEMEINLKEDGCKICVMEKVFFFLFNYLNFIKNLNLGAMWVNIGKGKLQKQVTGVWKKIKKQVEERNFFKMEIAMMELGKKTCLTEKEE